VLVIINFIVITKGTERISEVAARFTLDAMPGKQMSIDADLNSGLIDEKEAQRRRQEIEREADFYGAMDGATNFIRGDAIAAIIIIFYKYDWWNYNWNGSKRNGFPIGFTELYHFNNR
jgi:Flagellar biosynthesis pathway, component FlhA